MTVALEHPAAPVSTGPSAAAADTPRMLRLLTLATVLVGVLVGLVGAATFSALALSLGRAQDDVAQLVRVQRIQTSLLSADATATNAFLVGGLEPAEQRAAYDRALSDTGALIAEAARYQPADAAALSVLNQQVLGYAATIEQARANNRQGFPVGAQYLRNAGAQLRAGTLPVLDNLVAANRDRAESEMGVALGFVFVAAAAVALAAAVWAQIRIARRFKRRLNPGLLAGSAVLLVAFVAGLVGLLQLGAVLSDVRNGSLAEVDAAAEARIEAYNAKSNESLTLISRGSGQAYEAAWRASAASVEKGLDRLGDADLSQSWRDYAAVHTEIRELDDGGRWDQAVARATGTDDSSSNTAFSRFDTALAERLDQAGATTSTALSGRTPALAVGAALLVLAGIASALLGRRGIAERLREYR